MNTVLVVYYYIQYMALLYGPMGIKMDTKKLNRILRYIETEGGLNTTEYEYILATLNRMYLKRIIFQESKRDTFGIGKAKTDLKGDLSTDNSKSDTI